MKVGEFRPELLESEMVKKKMNPESLSNELGINPSTYYRKINGESEFNRQEMAIIRYVLGLSSDDMDSIFFAS